MGAVHGSPGRPQRGFFCHVNSDALISVVSIVGGLERVSSCVGRQLENSLQLQGSLQVVASGGEAVLTLTPK
jgi:hypothetical protein